MGTSAAVYVEKYNKVVRVNYDGYPEFMLPTLTYLVKSDLLSQFVEGVEFSSLAESPEQYQTVMEQYPNIYGGDNYINVPNVGWAYGGDAIVLTATVGADGVPVFSQEEDFHYHVTKDGDIKVLTRR